MLLCLFIAIFEREENIIALIFWSRTFVFYHHLVGYSKPAF